MAEQEFRHLVRVANTDIKGEIAVYKAMTKIKGMSFAMAKAICKTANVDLQKRAGDLTDEEVERLNTQAESMQNIPNYMLNRRKDYETGEDKHLMTTTLTYEQDNDIKRMKKIKSYKGLRHAWKLPVRGQRTKAHFRKGKALGVSRAGKKK